MNSDSLGQFQGSGPLLVDSHVHYHGCFDRSGLITSAIHNFESAASLTGVTNPIGMLIFVENYRSRDLSRLAAEPDKVGPWEFVATKEESSLAVYRDGVRRLILLTGRQIRTAESLEVLAIHCTEDIPDGKPIGETLRMVYSVGAIAVIPWGFGKWWFRRGRLVSKLIQEESPERFFLGDNGGRPRPSLRPVQFARAENRGIRILPGSDPLPLPGEEARVGSYGFVVPGSMDYDRPGESLKRFLEDPATSPLAFGRVSGWLSCLRRQVLVRAGGRPRSTA